MSDLQSSIEDALREIALPGTSQNLIDGGVLSRTIAREGRVSLVLEFPPRMPGSKDDLKAAIERRVQSVEGVESVQLLEKAAPQPGGPAPVAGPQGIPGVKHIVAVASGKGGVGKSTVAVNLAVSLAKAGQRVGLLDADVYGPSIPKMLGLEGAEPRVSPEERLLPFRAHGIVTMSLGFMLDDESPVIWRGPMVTGVLRQFIEQVDWGDLDVLVIDLPPGTGDAQLTLTQTLPLAGGVIVTTPQDVALLDVRRGIQMFERVNVRVLGIVENMSQFICPKCGHSEAIFDSGGGAAAAKRYNVPFLGEIPLESQYARAGDLGHPVAAAHPESALATQMAEIAAGLVEELSTT